MDGKNAKGAKGKTVACNRNGDLHARNVRSDGWSEAERAMFLDQLASTCNVEASAQAAEHSAQSAKALRRRDPAFRTQWDDALETGYAVLETMVLEKAQGVVSTPAIPATGMAQADRGGANDMTVRDAMALLDKHRTMVTRIRQGREAGYTTKAANAKQSCQEILRRLAVLKKRLDTAAEAE